MQIVQCIVIIKFCECPSIHNRALSIIKEVDSVVNDFQLAALHRWKRHEPSRRQRLCRQSLKRRREQQRSRQENTAYVTLPRVYGLHVMRHLYSHTNVTSDF